MWGLLFICPLFYIVNHSSFLYKKKKKQGRTTEHSTQKLERNEREGRKNRPFHSCVPYCLKYLKPFFLHRMEAAVLKHALLPLNLLLRSAEKRNGLAQTCDCRRMARVLCLKQHPAFTIRWQPCKQKMKHTLILQAGFSHSFYIAENN